MIVSNNKEDDITRVASQKSFLVGICIVLIILAAIRGKSVGADTGSYMAQYRKLEYLDFEYLSIQFKAYWVYYYTSKVFSLLHMPCQVWFGFVETVYVIPMYMLIKRYSQDYLLSILVFITCGLFMFSLAGLKQTLGMGLMMLSFISFIDRKYVRAVVLALLGYFSHPSVAIFFIGFALYYFRDSKYFNVIITAGLIVTFGVGEWLFTTLVTLNGDDHFVGYLYHDYTYTATTLIFYFSIVGLSLAGIKGYYAEDSIQMKLALGLSLLACGLQSLSSWSPNAFRLAYLFTPFFMILLPNSILSIKDGSDRRWVYLAAVFMLSFYFLYTARDSRFDISL